MNELGPRRKLFPLTKAFSELEKEFERAFNDDFFTGAFDIQQARIAQIPKLNIKENENEYTIEASLPGYNKKDIEIEATDNCLVIKSDAKYENEKQDEKGKWVYREISKRAFYRSIPLPKKVKYDEINNASFNDGILKIVLPKIEKEQKKAIKVEIR